MLNLPFFINSIMLGAGLAMDAFSVSLANGLNEPFMKRPKMAGVAGIFAFFQFFMPMLGWVFVHTVLQYFKALERAVPYVALVLLVFIGGKMIYDGVSKKEGDGVKSVGIGGLMVQAVATSIDALSVGFTIASYDLLPALLSCLIIGVVTFAICLVGIAVGKKFGTKLSDKASIFGGVILVIIGLEIFITGII